MDSDYQLRALRRIVADTVVSLRALANSPELPSWERARMSELAGTLGLGLVLSAPPERPPAPFIRRRPRWPRRRPTRA